MLRLVSLIASSRGQVSFSSVDHEKPRSVFICRMVIVHRCLAMARVYQIQASCRVFFPAVRGSQAAMGVVRRMPWGEWAGSGWYMLMPCQMDWETQGARASARQTAFRSVTNSRGCSNPFPQSELPAEETGMRISLWTKVVC